MIILEPEVSSLPSKPVNFCVRSVLWKSHYKHIKVTKFFTLYFIPLIPLGSAGEYVECQTCKGTFVPRSWITSPILQRRFPGGV